MAVGADEAQRVLARGEVDAAQVGAGLIGRDRNSVRSIICASVSAGTVKVGLPLGVACGKAGKSAAGSRPA
jgi:hypothetical protein